MNYTVKLQQFEGPLGILLQLIELEKLDISEISLAKVTEDYLKLLEQNPDFPPEELADFLVVASKLLLIKSKILLPYLEFAKEDEEEEGDLEAQLKIYKAYLDASEKIESLIGHRKFLYVHDKLPKIEAGFSPPKSLNIEQMRDMFVAVIKRLEPVVQSEKRKLEKSVSIHEKIQQIRIMLNKVKKISFNSIISTSQSKMEIIVSFLALLELIKQRNVSVEQDSRFSDISIRKLTDNKIE